MFNPSVAPQGRHSWHPLSPRCPTLSYTTLTRRDSPCPYGAADSPSLSLGDGEGAG